MSAYDQGRLAFYNGDEVNPFDESDAQWDEWHDGHHEAFTAEMEANPPVNQVMEH